LAAEGSRPVIRNETAMTLVELMIAMAVSIIALGVIYSTYRVQQRSYTNEQLVIDMQQNARSAMAFMRREIRLTGYNPRAHNGIDDDAHNGIDDAAEGVVAGFKTIRGDRIGFSFDLNGNGNDQDLNETIAYRFKSTDDADSDGIADSGAADLFRYNSYTDPNACSALAFDIQAVAFAYAFDSDGDGQLDTFPDAPNVVIWAWDADGNDTLDHYLDTNKDGVIGAADAVGGAALSTAVPMASIRAVQVWLLARTSSPIRGHTETETYVVGPKHISPGDSYKRSVLNGIVMIRNPGN
jgi:type II secretory pathway pseudopilin PulG